MALSAFGSTLKEAGNMMLQPPQDMDPNYTTVLEKLPLEDITNNYNFDIVFDEASETASFISNGRYNDENSNGRSMRKAQTRVIIGGPGTINTAQGRGVVLRKGFR
ncbi:hypothetical protein CKAN_01242900 [Cinnamomum micranthum f. kanehirae]|uniref:Uncharacterized protein n=1 Tax=Cinnamomum micranthum f. kanehirae TaxID=337451 RepID=A0A3S3MH74_9MAGN|nr:hypothetical protein CKAN_01242900 [Cinnamomum micranthum f. kanehirae]